MKNTKCWFWHTWSKWTDLGVVSASGHSHQVKKCQQCGIKKIRWYSAGATF